MNMKKRILLVLPMLALLTGCQEVKFGFSQGFYSSGLDHEVSSSQNEVPSYSYRSNDTLDTAGLNEANLIFTNIDKSYSDLQDEEKIVSFFNFDQAILTSISNPKYVGTKDDGTFFIGAESTYVNGTLTFNFNTAIKDVEIKAQPYYFIRTSYNQEELVADEEVAISVNDSGFIKLNETKDLENVTVKETTCAFHLAQESQTISLKVGKRRAIIKQITFYY